MTSQAMAIRQRQQSVSAGNVIEVHKRQRRDSMDTTETPARWWQGWSLPFSESISSYNSFRRMANWVLQDTYFNMEGMAPADPNRAMPLQEFDWADIVHAGCIGVDLSALLSEMPIFFWFFIIAIIHQFVTFAVAIMDIWIETIVYNCSAVAYIPLFVCVPMSWPTFISYMIQSLSHGAGVLKIHERTVQLIDVPDTHQTLESMQEYFQSLNLEVEDIEIVHTTNDRVVVEVLFHKLEDMKHAFEKEGPLHSDIQLGKASVRARPKTGPTTASVYYWLLLMRYFTDNVPPRYWLRGTLSCCVTMSLTKIVSKWVWMAGATIVSSANIFDVILRLWSWLSLGFIFFFGGYHAFHDIREAQRDLETDQGKARLGCRTFASPHLSKP